MSTGGGHLRRGKKKGKRDRESLDRTGQVCYSVCKITFGSEPKDYEVYEFLLKNWHKLKFSPPIQAEIVIERKINPKRMQREIQSQLQDKGIGTKAQQALKNH